MTPRVNEASQGLSTEEIMRIAEKRFIKTSTNIVDVVSMHNPFDVSLSGLSNEEAKKVDLVEFLLASIDNVGNQQYDHASILLDKCDGMSSSTGNAVQRVVYYFSKALRERINRETGSITSQDLEKLRCTLHRSPNHVENVAEAKKIHVIDIRIRIGEQWTGLMQALASQSEYPLELLKITAIGTTNKHLIEDTGKSSGYSGHLLRSLISLPDRLDSVMQVIGTFNPQIMVVNEPEVNTSSSSLVNRFIEALSISSAYFNCLEACVGADPNSIIEESSHLGEGIRNIAATEGKERNSQYMELDVWRAFFAPFWKGD
ncbi:hypothetical protein GH714_025470 [Hevea brasiliensis]|uniref:Uncharacterized protein n=1 Tax=Hevea brasiliensis TaxID=3981 RepID=A0A6A6KKQ1_HEVBR|nr:hypothetical protein GH714_025470 [Hevea brasiliensis]